VGEQQQQEKEGDRTYQSLMKAAHAPLSCCYYILCCWTPAVGMVKGGSGGFWLIAKQKEWSNRAINMLAVAQGNHPTACCGSMADAIAIERIIVQRVTRLGFWKSSCWTKANTWSCLQTNFQELPIAVVSQPNPGSAFHCTTTRQDCFWHHHAWKSIDISLLSV
jgi:hypothetical protein